MYVFKFLIISFGIYYYYYFSIGHFILWDV
jgi:hypothetical protein